MAKQIAKVGKYEIVELIARGGMGAVYKAKHPTLKRYVILKQLTLRGGSGFTQRFKREASLMIDFRNEHIVQVYDHFKEGSSYYIVMEYVDGIGLDKLIEERGKLSNSAAILIFTEICKGLHYAHQKNVIHRDIKPANILISRNGEVKLVDFGIATSKESDEDGLTRAGMTLGTPAYMSPEQIADTKNVDRRADIYSLGVVLYEMLTGQKPFPGGFTPESINRINRGIYTSPQKLNPSIPGFLRHLIRKSMNHKTSKRYRDIGHMINVISRFIRRYRDKDAINSDIKRYLSGTEITLPNRRALGRRKGFRLKVLIACVVLVVIGLVGLYIYEKGYYYEYLKKDEYGGVEIRATVPKGYYKDATLVYSYCRLKAVAPVEEEEKEEFDFRLTAGPSGIFGRIRSLILKSKEMGKDDEGDILTTGVLYLPEGAYTLELFVENAKFYRTFYLNPRSVQRENVKTYERQLLSFTLRRTKPKPIQIIPRVYDSVTGQSLYRVADISLYLKEKGRWINWKEYQDKPRLKRYLAGLMSSGMSYTLRFKAPQYYPETVKFRVENEFDSVRVEVALMKKPGRLVVESDYPGLRLLIDGRSESYLGEKERDFVSYGQTVSGKKEFFLSEGNYLLTVMKDKKRVENYQFSIVPEETTWLAVSYSTDDKKLMVVKK